MSDKTIYMKNIGIEGASVVVDDFHYYNGTIQTMSLNERHFFRCSLETLRSIQEQANAGVIFAIAIDTTLLHSESPLLQHFMIKRLTPLFISLPTLMM